MSEQAGTLGPGSASLEPASGEAWVAVAPVGATRSARLGPREIRSKRFSATRFGRSGLDPEEVRRFLGRIAAELVALHEELAGARAESRRLRAALLDWQTWYATRVAARTSALAGTPPNRSARYDRG